MNVERLIELLKMYPVLDVLVMMEYRIEIGGEIITKQVELKEVNLDLSNDILTLK